MKKSILISFFLIHGILSYGQITQPLGNLLFADTLNFRPLHSWININNPETNIWEVGQPSKSTFNKAHMGKLAIITDSTSSYPNNLNDYFYITIPLNYVWGEGILSFYHKFDTDTLTDGGLIEITYDNGASWSNIINDNHNIQKKFINIYDDTIKGGNYGYSGESLEWKYVEIYWWWLALTKQQFNSNPVVRFRFISDNTNNNRDGWMIDDIVFRGYSVTGTANESSMDEIRAYPNPSNSLVKFNIPEKYSSDAEVELIDVTGRVVYSKGIEQDQIDIRNLDSGLYTYKIYSGNKVISKGKLIKK
jgi:hypothetical protein